MLLLLIDEKDVPDDVDPICIKYSLKLKDYLDWNNNLFIFDSNYTFDDKQNIFKAVSWYFPANYDDLEKPSRSRMNHFKNDTIKGVNCAKLYYKVHTTFENSPPYDYCICIQISDTYSNLNTWNARPKKCNESYNNHYQIIFEDGVYKLGGIFETGFDAYSFRLSLLLLTEDYSKLLLKVYQYNEYVIQILREIVARSS